MLPEERKEFIKKLIDPVREQRNKVKHALFITYELAIDDDLYLKETLLLLNNLLKKFDNLIVELNNELDNTE